MSLKERRRSVNATIFAPLHESMEVLKSNGMCKSRVVEKCLCEPVTLLDVFKEENIVPPSGTTENGTKNAAFSLSLSVCEKLKKIKFFIPNFSVSVILNLCLLFPITINVLLKKMKEASNFVFSDGTKEKEERGLPPHILEHVRKIRKKL